MFGKMVAFQSCQQARMEGLSPEADTVYSMRGQNQYLVKSERAGIALNGEFVMTLLSAICPFQVRITISKWQPPCDGVKKPLQLFRTQESGGSTAYEDGLDF